MSESEGDLSAIDYHEIVQYSFLVKTKNLKRIWNVVDNIDFTEEKYLISKHGLFPWNCSKEVLLVSLKIFPSSERYTTEANIPLYSEKNVLNLQAEVVSTTIDRVWTVVSFRLAFRYPPSNLLKAS